MEDLNSKTAQQTEDGCLTTYSFSGANVWEWGDPLLLDATSVKQFDYTVHVRRYQMGRGSQGSFAELVFERHVIVFYYFDRVHSTLLQPDFDVDNFSSPFCAACGIHVTTGDLVGEYIHVAPDVEPTRLSSWLNETLTAPKQRWEYIQHGSEDQHQWGLGMTSRHSSSPPGTVITLGGVLETLRDVAEQVYANNLRKMHRVSPLAANAAGQAVQDHVDFVGVNLLESIYEWRQLFTMPTTYGRMRTVLNRLKRGEVAGLLNLGDEVANSILWSEFGFLPLVSDVKSYYQNWNRLVSTLQGRGLWGDKTLYGSVRLSRSDHYKYPTKISAHSKIVVIFEHNALMTCLLKLNAVGLMPRLANLWDCVPWSFAVDWFTSEGQRLNMMDWQGMLLLLPCYYSVNSVKLETTLPTDLIAGFDCDVVVSDYYRWLRQNYPTYGLESYDPFPVRTPEEVMQGYTDVVGSLAYTFLRK